VENQKGLSVPTNLDQAHRAMLNRLQQLNGCAFEKQFTQDQIAAHQQAISLFKDYAQNGSDQELKTWAHKTIPELEQHLQLADNLQK